MHLIVRRHARELPGQEVLRRRPSLMPLSGEAPRGGGRAPAAFLTVIFVFWLSFVSAAQKRTPHGRAGSEKGLVPPERGDDGKGGRATAANHRSGSETGTHPQQRDNGRPQSRDRTKPGRIWATKKRYPLGAAQPSCPPGPITGPPQQWSYRGGGDQRPHTHAQGARRLHMKTCCVLLRDAPR